MPGLVLARKPCCGRKCFTGLILLPYIGLVTAWGASVDSTQVVYPCPPLAEIIARMERADLVRRAALDQISTMRRYTFQNERFGKTAEMLVKAESHRGEPMGFEIMSEVGANGIAGRVFRHILDAEKETSFNEKSRISSDNYTFELLGSSFVNGRRCYELKLIPKEKSKYLLEGTAWVDTLDYGFVRIEGRPSASLSFLVGRPTIAMDFEKVGDYWFIARNQSHAQGHLAGISDLKIEYFSYRLHPCNPGNSALAARNENAAQKPERTTE